MSYKVQLLRVHIIGANHSINVLFPPKWTESSDCYSKSLSGKIHCQEQFWSHSFNYRTHILHLPPFSLETPLTDNHIFP